MTSSSTSRALLFVVLAVAAVLGTAHGASYTVGGPAGSWDLQTNYTNWVSGITFCAGDELVFESTAARSGSALPKRKRKYTRRTTRSGGQQAQHSVLEVSKADYDACSGATPLVRFPTGSDDTTVPLSMGGVTRYFICGVPGHCAAGMKLAVRVEGGAVTAAAGPNVSPPSSSAASSLAGRRSVGRLGLAAFVVAGLFIMVF